MGKRKTPNQRMYMRKMHGYVPEQSEYGTTIYASWVWDPQRKGLKIQWLGTAPTRERALQLGRDYVTPGESD